MKCHKAVKSLPSLQSVQKDKVKSFTMIKQLRIGDTFIALIYNILLFIEQF